MRFGRVLPLLWLTVVLCGAAGLQAAEPARPPQQPADGAGGRAYRFSGLDTRRVGQPPTGATVFLPAAPDAAAGERPVPVVVFLHGFTAVDPAVYRGWIDHLVRRGAAVVYPDYQLPGPFATETDAMLANAIAGIRGGVLEVVRSDVAADATRMAVVGHSLGGVLAAGVVASAGEEGLPTPVALMVINPGGCRGCGGPGSDGGVPLPDLRTASPELLTLVVVSEDDGFVRDFAARAIWRGLAGIAAPGKTYAVLRSDRHGEPDLVADHNAPQTAGRWVRETADALDWYGLWKPLDVMLGCAFAKRSCGAALSPDGAAFDMGEWSDGVPVRRPIVSDRPVEIAR
jgi:acetyl esterase/lipase